MSETVLYVGYGANRDSQMMEAIIGGTPKILGRAAIQDVELCIQRHDQITDTVVATAPAPLSPKQIMVGAWGENSNFEAYAIRPKEGSTVAATLFELTQLQRDLVAEWELVEFGWYDHMSAGVTLEDGTKLEAVTEGFTRDQAIDRTVDGQNYATFLADPAAMFATAEKARLDYLEQLES